MIKLNEFYFPEHNIKGDRTVYDIHVSDEALNGRSYERFLVDLLDNGAENEDCEIHRMKLTGPDTEDYTLDIQKNYAPTRTVLDDEDITEFDDVTNTRRAGDLKRKYDSFDRNYVGHGQDFVEKPMNSRLFRENLCDALNILPSLMHEDDIDTKEKMRLSKMGQSLMWQDFVMKTFTRDENPFPSREDIEFYDRLNPYEKRLVRSTYVQPASLISDIRDMQSVHPGAVFTQDMYNTVMGCADKYEKTRPQGRDLFPETVPVPAEIKEYAEREFTEKLSRAPRVLPELLSALYKANGNKLEKKDIDAYIGRFAPEGTDKRDAGRSFIASFGKIAQKKSENLYAISQYLNFALVPDDAIKVFEVYVNPQKAKAFGENGFFSWYEKHTGLPINDVIEILTAFDYAVEEYSGGQRRMVFDDLMNSGRFIKFSPDESVDDIMFEESQLRGEIDCKGMERDYGYRFGNNDCAIKGRDVIATDGKYTALMLSSKDYRNFTVGYDTCCCQHYRGAGESCVWHLTSDPYAGQFVIVKNSQMKGDLWYKGPAVAQGYVWTDEAKSTIVLDNIEFRRTTEENFDHRVGELTNVIGAWAEALPYENVHIGIGCNQGCAGLGHEVTYQAAMPHTLRGDRYIYSDYYENARSIKKGGVMDLVPVGDASGLSVRHKEKEDSLYDFLSDKKVAWVASADMTITEKRAFADAFLTDQTPEIQEKAFDIDPASIEFIEHPILSIQEKIVAGYPDLISKIHNAAPSIYNILITNDPHSIFTIENPDRDAWKAALKGDGLLLGKCPYHDTELYLEAVKQNGLAVKYVPDPSPVVQMEAIRQNVNAISFMRNPSTDAVLTAARREPSLVQNMRYLRDDTKTVLARELPKTVMYMDRVPREAMLEAVSRDGMLIRLSKNPDREIMFKAVQNNPMAIRYIRNPDVETAREAVRQNPAVMKYVRLPEEEKQALLNEPERA